MHNNILVTKQLAQTHAFATVEQVDLGALACAIHTNQTRAGEQLWLTKRPIFGEETVIIYSHGQHLWQLRCPGSRLEMQA